MKYTLDFYKAAVKAALEARVKIVKARERREESVAYEKEQYDSERIGLAGYNENIEKINQERDSEIESALKGLEDLREQFKALTDGLAKMDGSRIDEATMRLLDSGIELTPKEWQELADRHKDDFIMTRILRRGYDARPRPKPDLNGVFPEEEDVKFGQSPIEKQEIFDKFISTLKFSCQREYMEETPDGCDGLESYWNKFAMNSIGRMKPFGWESFEDARERFSVRYKTIERDYNLW